MWDRYYPANGEAQKVIPCQEFLDVTTNGDECSHVVQRLGLYQARDLQGGLRYVRRDSLTEVKLWNAIFVKSK